MTPVELTAESRWLISAMRAEGIVLPVYPDQAPEDEKGRHILINVALLPDVNRQSRRLMSKAAWTVRVQDRVGGYSALEDDAAAIDRALQMKSGNVLVGGMILLACYRETPFASVVVFKGEEYRQLGGTYRVIISGGG